MAVQMIDGKLLRTMVAAGAKYLEDNKQTVDELNVFPVPDGDTGTNMSLTIQNSVAELERLSGDGLGAVAKAVSSGALIGARGNSGVILSQLFRGLADACKNEEMLGIEGVAKVCRRAADAAYKAVMKPIEGTILTVAREMAEFAMDHKAEYDELGAFVQGIITHGRKALAGTPELLPVLKEAGVVDSGGQGLMFICEGAYLALTGKTVVEAKKNALSDRERFVDDSGMKPEDLTYGYCTEFIVKDAAKADENELRAYLNTIGDCVLVIKDEDIIKVHVHTDHPGQAFEKGLSLGQLTRMKVDNMREMFGNAESTASEETRSPEPVERPRLDHAFIGVSSGDGFTEIFKELGMTRVITGGQTMNPSTQNFLDEIAAVNADVVYLFPNNGNIIMAANQAKAICEEAQVHVIPTKTFPQCVMALLTYDGSVDAAANAEGMKAAIATVKTGEITYAVRDTKVSGLKIKKGNIIAVEGGEIRCKGDDIEEVTRELIEKMIDEETGLVTLYYGEDVSEADAHAFGAVLEEVFPDVDVEVHAGGQPLYYYIVSVE